MFHLCAYILLLLIALIWVSSDSDPTSAYEAFRSELHSIAKEMGIYWDWLIRSLLRSVRLLLLVAASMICSWLMFKQNPFDFDQHARLAVLVAMFAGACLLVALPLLIVYFRFIRLAYSKTFKLSNLVSLVNSPSGILQELESAEYSTKLSWTAWHPKGNNWQESKLWSGLVPVAYLRLGTQGSLVVPIDWCYFITWNIPDQVQPGTVLPFTGPHETKFLVKSIHKMLGRRNWLIVRADMDSEILAG